MSITGLNSEKCEQRNRIAAKRDNVDAMPIRLMSRFEAERGGNLGHPQERVLSSYGNLPMQHDTEAIVSLINSLQGMGRQLSADDVHVHYAEAANDNFVGDRYLFLAPSTLKNIAGDASKGIAFMNSHRTGGLSHPSELPFGRTFAGQYEQYARPDGTVGNRATIGMYMLRGVRPNGDGGPSTDDLSAMIDAGTVQDVSVGLYGGDRICDVCGNDLEAENADGDGYLCEHAPGTDHKMTKEQRAAQEARGVTKGYASYSLSGSHMGEVSAVYDGAVPGAGFRKALALSKQGQLSISQTAQARSAYATLLSKGDFVMDMEEIKELITSSVQTALQRVGLKPQTLQAGHDDDRDDGDTQPTDPEAGDEDTEVGSDVEVELGQAYATLTADTTLSASVVSAELDALRNQLAQERNLRITRDAEAFASQALIQGKMLPVELAGISELYLQLSRDDEHLPLTGQPSRVETFKALIEKRPAHSLTEEALQAKLESTPTQVVFNKLVTTDTDNAAMSDERYKKLMGLTPLGNASLKNGNGSNGSNGNGHNKN